MMSTRNVGALTRRKTDAKQATYDHEVIVLPWMSLSATAVPTKATTTPN